MLTGGAALQQQSVARIEKVGYDFEKIVTTCTEHVMFNSSRQHREQRPPGRFSNADGRRSFATAKRSAN